MLSNPKAIDTASQEPGLSKSARGDCGANVTAQPLCDAQRREMSSQALVGRLADGCAIDFGPGTHLPARSDDRPYDFEVTVRLWELTSPPAANREDDR